MDASNYRNELLQPTSFKNNKEEAKDITDYVAQETERKYEDKKEAFAAKTEIAGVREKIHELRLHLETRLEAIKSKFDSLDVRIKQNTNKLLLWLVSVIFASAGLILVLIKLLYHKLYYVGLVGRD